MKTLAIELGGQRFRARLFEDKAPLVIAALEKEGPFLSPIVYAKICDNEITWPTPFLVDAMENPVWDEEPGSVIYYPPHQAICIFYGPTPSVAWCSQIGIVDSDELARLKGTADKVWAHQGQTVRTSVVEEA